MHIVYQRPTLDLKNTQDESEKTEKDTLWKWKPKESRGSHTNRTKQTLGKKTVTKDKKRHYIMKKRSSHQEDITSTYKPNIKAPKYMKQTLKN